MCLHSNRCLCHKTNVTWEREKKLWMCVNAVLWIFCTLICLFSRSPNQIQWKYKRRSDFFVSPMDSQNSNWLSFTLYSLRTNGERSFWTCPKMILLFIFFTLIYLFWMLLSNFLRFNNVNFDLIDKKNCITVMKCSNALTQSNTW